MLVSGMVLVGLRECADMALGAVVLRNEESPERHVYHVGRHRANSYSSGHGHTYFARIGWVSHMCGNSSSETSSLIYLTEYPHPPHNPTATQPEAPPTIGHHGVTVIGTGNNDNEVGAGLAERHTYQFRCLLRKIKASQPQPSNHQRR